MLTNRYPAVAGLLPWPGGIRRGATVAAVGSTSLIMVLLATVMAAGSWASVVGMPAFGALAAAEVGVPLERLALVPDPGPDWPAVVSALIDPQHRSHRRRPPEALTRGPGSSRTIAR